MHKIAIIGYGNVGYHFSKILSKSNQVSIFSRNPKEEYLNDFSSFAAENFDFVFLTVSDDSIETVANSFETTDTIVVHTSGSKPLSNLKNHQHTAVIYPLQTFTKHQKVDVESLQIFVECSANISEKVQSIAKMISENVKTMNSVDRGKIHLAAVFACNFTNHLFGRWMDR